MKVVIIEDEPLAADKLTRYLQKYDSAISILCTLNSIASAVTWIAEHEDIVDLFFMDVQLTDGLSFEIFNQLNLSKPVIFTTAFDEFAIDAFKVNSIDYLLKPITFTNLSKSLQKLKTMRMQFAGQSERNERVKQLTQKAFKDRFLVRIGNHIHAVKSEDISFFYAEGRDAYLITSAGKKYIVEYKLEVLEELLDPKSFFRINRSFIVHINAITDVVVYANRRLKLVLNHSIEKEVIVSREKVGAFKLWFEGI